MSKKHYHGQSNRFFLLAEEKSELPIISFIDHPEEVIYHLSAPEIDFRKRYYVMEEHGFKTPLIPRYVVKDHRFHQRYATSQDLGVVYSKEATDFRLFAPTAHAVILHLEEQYLPMQRAENGLFELKVQGDLLNKRYTYLVDVAGAITETIDPYGYSSTANAEQSVVVDIKPIGNLKKKVAHPIIYELSVRDFTVTAPVHHPGKYLGLAETGIKSPAGHPVGLDYLVDLGITHVQLMPIFDFATLEEKFPDPTEYNWGYDPLQFGVPEGTYVVDHNDLPNSRVREVQKMMEALHQKGIGVIMDVVFNHVYDAATFSLAKVIPYYPYRLNEQGEKSNGSFCHNDLDSKQPMVRHLILTHLKRWMKLYGIDGFRFDLMGILDVATMNEIARELQKINPNVILYGEGWNMPTFLPDEEKATREQGHRLPAYAFFNDHFRDALRGGLFDQSHGYLMGNKGRTEQVKKALTAHHVINYVEVHDNKTLRDHLVSLGSNKYLNQQIILGTALTLLSGGIPFLHSGQEYGRTKGGHDNSYNLSDEINHFSWEQCDQNYHLVQITKELIKLYKKESIFRLLDREEVGFDDGDTLVYSITNQVKTVYVNINASDQAVAVTLPAEAEIIFDQKNVRKKAEKAVINPFSLIVYQERKKES